MHQPVPVADVLKSARTPGILESTTHRQPYRDHARFGASINSSMAASTTIKYNGICTDGSKSNCFENASNGAADAHRLRRHCHCGGNPKGTTNTLETETSIQKCQGLLCVMRAPVLRVEKSSHHCPKMAVTDGPEKRSFPHKTTPLLAPPRLMHCVR